MSYFPLSDKDKEIVAQRKETFKAELRRRIFKSVLPEILVQDDLVSFVDVTLGVDRKALLAESLREVADLVDGRYTFEDVKGGHCE